MASRPAFSAAPGPGARRGVVVVGSVNIDHVVTVERLPEAGQTVSGSGYLSVPGGKGLNQAVTAARLGASVAMVACVGDDAPGRVLRQVLSAEGIGTAAVRHSDGWASGTALITVDRSGANTIVVAPAPTASWRRAMSLPPIASWPRPPLSWPKWRSPWPP